MPQDVISALLFREYLLNERQALLMRVDYIERLLQTTPRTSELRKEAKEQRQVERDNRQIVK